MPWNAIKRLQRGWLHLYVHACNITIPLLPAEAKSRRRREKKNAFPNELPARALIARAHRELHGVSWGRSRAALDFHIYISWRREAESRVWGQVGLLLLAAYLSAAVARRVCIRFAGDRCRLRCFDLRSAEMQMTARGEELCARHRERAYEQYYV